jgi:hypothetical protein
MFTPEQLQIIKTVMDNYGKTSGFAADDCEFWADQDLIGGDEESAKINTAVALIHRRHEREALEIVAIITKAEGA